MKKISFYKDKDSKKGNDLNISDRKGDPSRLWYRNKVVIGVSITVVLTFLFFGAYANFMKRPLSSNIEDYRYFEIKTGESTYSIGKRLEKEKIIRSAFAFFLTSKIEDRGTLQAGNYKLSPSMDTGDIVDKINRGKVDAFSVTIPEGYRVLQIAKVLEQKGQVKADKFIDAAGGTEGTLFPDTYVFPYNLEPTKIIKIFRDNYETRTDNLNLDSDQLILASIVEREAKSDDERAKIAAVYKNRADNNMLLQADPTVQYVRDTQKYLKEKSVDFSFWEPITKQDYLDINSAFNSYKNKGYPPAPICNPGLKSIQAALNPEQNFDYLYFFHDRNQTIHFSKTYEEQCVQSMNLAYRGCSV